MRVFKNFLSRILDVLKKKKLFLDFININALSPRDVSWNFPQVRISGMEFHGFFPVKQNSNISSSSLQVALRTPQRLYLVL